LLSHRFITAFRFKGVEYAIRAFVSVVKEVPAARLVIVGDGVERVQLEALAKELGIHSAIDMRGWVKGGDELYRLYEESQVVLVPSVWPENLPTVCIEAMAIGRPVIGTNTGGIPELIADGESGFIVPMRDSAALAEKILQLFHDETLRTKMGEHARKRSAQFRIERFVDEVLGLYREVVSLNPFLLGTRNRELVNIWTIPMSNTTNSPSISV
jgi:glycosyltransferase involved in cell wall biosynthesis